MTIPAGLLSLLIYRCVASAREAVVQLLGLYLRETMLGSTDDILVH